MKAITLRQPWAWAVMHGGKDVENRTRNIVGSYRGPVAITAGVARVEGAAWSEVERISEKRFRLEDERFGVVLGVVDIMDVHLSDTRAETWDSTNERSVQCSPWALPESWHIVLANPRPFPAPIPVKGRLGLWTLPDDVASQVEEALR